MKYLSSREKSVLPEMCGNDAQRQPLPTDHVLMGRVEIDNTGCNGCELCVDICPASALQMTGQFSVGMTGDGAACIGCGDCVPICLPRVIKVTRFQEYDGLYRFIGRGQASPPRKF